VRFTTSRQHVGRLVRKLLSFSKDRKNHIGAIWYFTHRNNAFLGLRSAHYHLVTTDKHNKEGRGYYPMHCRIYHRFLYYFIPLTLTLYISASFLRDLDDMASYHGDENLWIAVGSRAFQKFFIEHDIHNPFWQEEYYTWGSYHPQLAKYLIGAGSYFGGYHEVPILWYDFTQDVIGNQQNGNILDSAILRSARVPIALTGIAACLILFWIVRFTAGTWYGVIAVVSIYQSHLLYVTSRRAMIDVPALCFSLLTLLCLIFLRRAIRDGNAKLMIIWSTTTGIASGLAVSSKMNGLLIVIICGVVIGIEYFYTLRSPVHSALNTVACSIIMLTLTVLIFVGSNPFLYSDPIVGTQHLLSLSQLLKTDPSAMTTTLNRKLLAVWNQILTYAPLNQNQLPGDLWLLLLGLVALTATAVKTPRFFVEKSLDIITIWITTNYIVITSWLPVNYPRYMLPLQPCNAFLVAYGVGWLVTNVASQTNRLLTQQDMV
jgi:hypothetical protein